MPRRPVVGPERKSGTCKKPAERVVKDIRLVTRKKYSAEEKIRIALEGNAQAGHEPVMPARISL